MTLDVVQVLKVKIYLILVINLFRGMFIGFCIFIGSVVLTLVGTTDTMHTIIACYVTY